MLEERFTLQKYLSSSDRYNLATELGLNQMQVKTWYQNRRMKWKKEVMGDGVSTAPTKAKGRPRKDSIPELCQHKYNIPENTTETNKAIEEYNIT
ncbi:hypothetical protein GJ496_003201 [Pomphorhynchus laevis]|nr:hypothetical protein GJ496_003201 [Pomphorhynchus laevis]